MSFNVTVVHSKATTAALRSNLFSVKFLKLHTLSETDLELLELLTCESNIPGTTYGWSSKGLSWYVRVLMADTTAYDTFKKWSVVHQVRQ